MDSVVQTGRASTFCVTKIRYPTFKLTLCFCKLATRLTVHHCFYNVKESYEVLIFRWLSLFWSGWYDQRSFCPLPVTQPVKHAFWGWWFESLSQNSVWIGIFLFSHPEWHMHFHIICLNEIWIKEANDLFFPKIYSYFLFSSLLVNCPSYKYVYPLAQRVYWPLANFGAKGRKICIPNSIFPLTSLIKQKMCFRWSSVEWG